MYLVPWYIEIYKHKFIFSNFKLISKSSKFLPFAEQSHMHRTGIVKTQDTKKFKKAVKTLLWAERFPGPKVSIICNRKEKWLTTSTLCLPGSWGMEYLMRPKDEKGCREKEGKSKIRINEKKLGDFYFILFFCRWKNFSQTDVCIPVLGLKHLHLLEICGDKSWRKKHINVVL